MGKFQFERSVAKVALLTPSFTRSPKCSIPLIRFPLSKKNSASMVTINEFVDLLNCVAHPNTLTALGSTRSWWFRRRTYRFAVKKDQVSSYTGDPSLLYFCFAPVPLIFFVSIAYWGMRWNYRDSGRPRAWVPSAGVDDVWRPFPAAHDHALFRATSLAQLNLARKLISRTH